MKKIKKRKTRVVSSLGNNPKFMGVIERSRARHKAEGGISSAEMRRRLGMKKERRTG